jgi:hypothetical protein
MGFNPAHLAVRELRHIRSQCEPTATTKVTARVMPSSPVGCGKSLCACYPRRTCNRPHVHVQARHLGRLISRVNCKHAMGPFRSAGVLVE